MNLSDIASKIAAQLIAEKKIDVQVPRLEVGTPTLGEVKK